MTLVFHATSLEFITGSLKVMAMDVLYMSEILSFFILLHY